MTKGSPEFPTPSAVCTSPADFVAFWSSLYSDAFEHLYEQGIRPPLTRDKLLDLFVWKNGGRLSAKKRRSVETNYLDHIPTGVSLARAASATDFLSRFQTGGPIWRIFFMHCCNPGRFPIFDQHVWRAYQLLHRSPVTKMSENNRATIEAYTESYLPFWDSLIGCADPTSVDRALWCFGKTCKPVARGVNWWRVFARPASS